VVLPEKVAHGDQRSMVDVEDIRLQHLCACLRRQMYHPAIISGNARIVDPNIDLTEGIERALGQRLELSQVNHRACRGHESLCL
jgi:hypothetical protein